jgi:UDP-N-acetyl-D-glucosamine dehydrogenase
MDNFLVKTLTEKINSKTSRIGIIGLGYVGVPLAQCFLGAGFEVIGFDIDEERVKALTSGKRCFTHIDPKPIKKFVADEKFKIYMDKDNLPYCDVILICVPTPLTASRDPDMQYIEEACFDIARNLRRGQLIILESTTYPGTTENLVVKILENNGGDFKAGEDFFVAFSPEREDPGNKTFNLKNTPKVIGGLTPACATLANVLYCTIVNSTVLMTSCAAAEMTKILENTYRTINIAFINEMKLLCHKLDIDIWEIIKAASTKPFGFQPFYPGLGLGGHCLPLDPHYLSYRARQVEMPTRFIDVAGEINWEMPRYVARRVQDALNTRGRSVKGAMILVLGIAYKKNIGDTRESPALKMIEELKQLEATVSYYDPFVKANLPMTQVASLSKEGLENTDCVVLAVDHDGVDYPMVLEHACLIVDTKNVFPRSEKVVPA